MDWRAREYTRSLDAVCERLHVNREHNCVSAREQALERGLRALGWHVDRMPRNVTECEQGKICGYCGYGCAIERNSRRRKTCWQMRRRRVRGLWWDASGESSNRGGAATGWSVSKGGHRVSVKCKTVVVACERFIRGAVAAVRIGERTHWRHLHLLMFRNSSE